MNRMEKHKITTGPELISDVEAKMAAVKMSVGGGGVIVYKLTLNEWVAVLTIIYMVIQTLLILPRFKVLLVSWWNSIMGKSNDRIP